MRNFSIYAQSKPILNKMTENLNSKIKNSQIKEDLSDEIDLRLFLNLLLRNKATVGLISVIMLFLGILYSFSKFIKVVSDKQWKW